MWQRESQKNLQSPSGVPEAKVPEDEQQGKRDTVELHNAVPNAFPVEGEVEDADLRGAKGALRNQDPRAESAKQVQNSKVVEQSESSEVTPRSLAIAKRPWVRKQFSRKRGRRVVARRLEHKLRELKDRAKSEALEMQYGAKSLVEGVYSEKRRAFDKTRVPVTIFHISWLIHVWMPTTKGTAREHGWVEAQAQMYDAIHGVLEVIYGTSFVRSPRSRSGVFIALGKTPVRLVRPLEIFEDQYDSDMLMTPRSLREENVRLFARVKRLIKFLVGFIRINVQWSAAIATSVCLHSINCSKYNSRLHRIHPEVRMMN